MSRSFGLYIPMDYTSEKPKPSPTALAQKLHYGGQCGSYYVNRILHTGQRSLIANAFSAKSDLEHVAIKAIVTNPNDNELSHLKKLNHQNVVTLLDSFQDDVSNVVNFY